MVLLKVNMVVFRKFNLSDEDVTVLVFTESTAPQFADLNFEGNIKSECELDFNCVFEKRHNSFYNIDNYTGEHSAFSSSFKTYARRHVSLGFEQKRSMV